MEIFQEHPLFKAPRTTAPLWRYMHVSKLLSLLTRRSLFFSRLDKLEDAYEGRFSDATVARFPSLRDYERHNNALAVNCWSLAPADSSLHWNTFCRGGYGVAIVSSYARLKQALVRSSDYPDAQLFITRVRYVNFEKYMHVPEEGFPINLFATVATKRLQFRAENEVRLILWDTNYRRRNSVVAERGGTYVALNLARAIDSVVCGPGTPAWLVDDIAGILRRYRLTDVPVRRSKVDGRPDR